MNQSEILVDNPVVQKIFVTVAFSFTIILSTASVLGKLDYLYKYITYDLLPCLKLVHNFLTL